MHMKKLYFLSLLSISVLTKAQNPIEIKDIDNSFAVVTNSQTFVKSTTANGLEFPYHFQIKNTSANTLTFSVRKYEDMMNAAGGTTAQAYFCFNTFCYTPGVSSATIQLPAGTTFSFIPKLDEASAVGETDLRYKISDGTPADDFWMYLKYNPPVGVKENAALFANAGSFYPNPSSSKTSADITVAQDVSGTTLSVFNSLGAQVLSKEVTLHKGKNTVSIDTENLESGIYFVRIVNGESRITKKITINK
jgi:hypothetical protein